MLLNYDIFIKKGKFLPETLLLSRAILYFCYSLTKALKTKDIEYENSKNYIYEEKLLFSHSYLVNSYVVWS